MRKDTPSNGIANYRWGYVVLISNFTMTFMDAGLAKSFGVLIPVLVERLAANYATIGFICSLTPTMFYLISPVVSIVLERVNHRLLAMAGGLISGASLVACAFISNTILLGLCLALTGVGMGFTNMTLVLLLNEYFQDNFSMMYTISLFGFTAGSMTLPVVTERILEAYGYQGTCVILGAIVLNVIVCGATVRKPESVSYRAIRNDCSDAGDEKEPIDIPLRRMDEPDQVAGYKSLDNSTDSSKSRPNILPQITSNGVNANVCNTTKATNSGQKINSHPYSNEVTQDDVEDEQSTMTREADDEDDEDRTSPGRSLIEDSENAFQQRKIRPWSTILRSISETFVFQEPAYSCTIPYQFLTIYVLYAWMFFLVPNAVQKGISQSHAVLLSTIAGVSGVVGKLMFTVLLAFKFNPVVIFIIIGCVCSCSFLVDFTGSGFGTRAVLASVQGFCFFIADSCPFTLVKELVKDERNFRYAMGLAGFVTGIGATTAGLLTGYLVDVINSYTNVFILIGFVHLLGVISLIASTCYQKCCQK